MTRARSFKRALYVVPVVGAMVFGAAQAFASPTAQQSTEAWCNQTQCANSCGGPGQGGCANGRCICF